MSRGEDFWSRRKAQVEQEAQAELRAAEAAALAEQETAQADIPDEELLEELGLPDPDSLQPGDDFSAFMAKAVPDRLRRRALRRLWLSNPALANLDGLLDYGEDFTDSATVIENLQTVYQVGRGMLKHVADTAHEAELAGAQAESAAEAGHAGAEVPAAEAMPEALPEITPPEITRAGPDTPETDPQGAEEAFAALPRRRMQFTFDDHAGGAG